MSEPQLSNDKGLDADDVLDALNSEDEPEKKEPVKDDEVEEEEEKEDEEEEKEDDEEEDDEDEIELKDKEDEEEKLDLKQDDIDVPPRMQDLKKAYPDLFKKFPFVKKVLFRDKEYSELFGSLDEAREIAGKVDVLAKFESDLLAGNTANILKTIKDTDEKSFDRLVDNYMINLLNVDKDAYLEVSGNVVKSVIKALGREAKARDDDKLNEVAVILNQFVFGKSEFEEPKPRVAASKDDEDKGESERQAFLRERFEASREELQTKADNVLKSTIADYIDPKGEMSAYVKRNAVNDALGMLNDLLSKDSSLSNNLNRLWRSAAERKFSKESLDKIKSAYLGRAKQSLRTVIKKARAEALKDSKPRKKSENNEEEPSSNVRRERVAAGRPSSQRRRANQMEEGESVEDFFARD